MVLLVLNENRLESFLWPEFRSADFLQAGGIPIESRARRRPACRHGFRDGIDVVRFWIDVNRRWILHHGNNLFGVRQRPRRAAVAAPAGVVHQLSIGNVTVFAGVGAVWIFAKAYAPQHHGRMPADGAGSGIFGVAFAIKLHEGAVQSDVFSRRVAVVAFEGRPRLHRHIWTAGRQLGIHRIAEVLRAVDAVGEIRAAQIAAVAVTHWNRAKRPLGFANDVEPPPEPAGARRVHGEVAGGFHRPFAHFLQIERARSLQNHRCDLAFADADMSLQPRWNVYRLLRRALDGLLGRLFRSRSTSLRQAWPRDKGGQRHRETFAEASCHGQNAKSRDPRFASLAANSGRYLPWLMRRINRSKPSLDLYLPKLAATIRPTNLPSYED